MQMRYVDSNAAHYTIKFYFYEDNSYTAIKLILNIFGILMTQKVNMHC